MTPSSEPREVHRTVASSEPSWLSWARELQAIAQSGLAFSNDPYDVERYERVRAIAIAMLSTGSTLDPEPLELAFAEETGYATPKVDVRGVVFRQGAILLVRERADGRWTLPGGWAEVSDTPKQCVEREILEEAGLVTRARRLLAVHDRARRGHRPHHAYGVWKMFFECEIVAGEPRPGLETTDAGFFREAEIPPLSLGRTLPDQIARMFEHGRDPDLPIDFD